MRIVEPPRKRRSQGRQDRKPDYLAGRVDLFRWLGRVKNDNGKGEYYLTDIIAEATHEEALVRADIAPESAVMGADTPMQLAQAEYVFQKRRRDFFLGQGVAMTAPETVFVFTWDTRSRPGPPRPYCVRAGGRWPPSGDPGLQPHGGAESTGGPGRTYAPSGQARDGRTPPSATSSR